MSTTTTTAVTTTFKDRAIIGLKYGIPVIPLHGKAPYQKEWQNHPLTTPAQVDAHDQQSPDDNAGLLAQGKIGGFCCFEVDSADVAKRYKQDTGEDLPKDTLLIASGGGAGRGHRWFRHTAASIALGNVSQSDVMHGDFSFRANNEQAVAPGSIHPDTGNIYNLLKAPEEIPSIPEKLLGWISQQSSAKKAEPQAAQRNERGKVPHGQIHAYMLRKAGQLRQSGLDGNALEDALVAIIYQDCEEPLDDEKIHKMAKSINKYPQGGDPNEIPLIGGVPAGSPKAAPAPAPDPQAASIFNVSNADEPWKLYGMTPDAYEVEMDKEFPVLSLPSQPGPAWTDDILYGITGQIIKKASEYCEAHPAGMYLDLLVAMGSIFGRHAHFKIGPAIHYANEFVVRVGQTSVARKGTGQSVINDIIQKLDSNWYKNRILGGFGSSQAIIYLVRDSFMQQIKKNSKGSEDPTFKDIEVPGVEDKRLFIREGELAAIFKLASANESQVDVVLRNGWDSTSLRNIVKGKSMDGISNSARCDEPHLSISADTTASELVGTMPNGADQNGFGNRFLYCYVYRTKLCPSGSPDIAWDDEIVKLLDAIVFAQSIDYVPLSDAAGKLWNRMYDVIEQSRPQGLVGLMTARGPAHVRRLALILALLDLSPKVECQHLQAAKKIWEYSEESVLFIFAGVTRDQQKILNFVRAHSTVTGPQIIRQLFWNHRPASWVRDQVSELQRNGWLAVSGDQIQLGKRGSI